MKKTVQKKEKIPQQNHDDSQDLTQGKISKQLWSLAWPMMLSVFFYTLYNIVDAYWVSKLSSEAIAAVSISQVTLFLMMSLGFGITAGSGVLMAMQIGAKNIKEAERILGQSFFLSIIVSLVFTVLSLIFREELLVLAGASGLVFQPALEYFTIIALGSIMMFLMMSIMFAYNSQGDTNTPTKLFAISTLVNLILDPLLIFGWYGFPELGISGAAIATLISQTLFIVIGLRSLSSEKRKLRFRFSNVYARWNSVKEVVKIGFPAALTQIIFPIGLSVLTFMVSDKFFEAGAVAISLGFRVEFFAYLPAVGFGFAAMAMVGQNIGAGKVERAVECFRLAIRNAFFSALGLGLVVALFAIPIIHFFTTDPLVTQYAKLYYWSVALTYGFLAAMMVEAMTFQAIGRSWPGFWIFVLRAFVLMLPLAYLCVYILEMSILSVWVSVMIANIVAAVLGYFWIRSALGKVVNVKKS